MTTRQLRWVELVTFGVPLAFFLLLQHQKIGAVGRRVSASCPS